MLAAGGVERVFQARRVRQQLTLGWRLGVENAQRIGLQAAPAVLAQPIAEGLEETAQGLAIGRAGLLVADRVQQHHQLGVAQLTEEPDQHRQQLGVPPGPRVADQLGADLVELAVASLLRPLVAKVGADIEQALRQRPVVQSLLDEGAHHRRGGLGAQGQAAALLVVEGVHLLADDVGGLSHPAHEELRVLEQRRPDLAVAVVREDPPGDRLDGAPEGGVLGQQVTGALDTLQTARHQPASSSPTSTPTTTIAPGATKTRSPRRGLTSL